jgi:hypothetical protein
MRLHLCICSCAKVQKPCHRPARECMHHVYPVFTVVSATCVFLKQMP